MLTINTSVLNKYKSYSDVQIIEEFLTEERNKGKKMVTPRYFVNDVVGHFLAKSSADGKTFVYSYVKESIDLLQALYDLYMDNFSFCDYALNLEALARVLDDFTDQNSKAISKATLSKHFEDFFKPILRRAYTYRNNYQVVL